LVEEHIGTFPHSVPRFENITGRIIQRDDEFRRRLSKSTSFHALVDSFAKVFITCVPEPRGEAMQTALGEARNRHAWLLTNVGHAMLSDSMAAMEELISRGEK
jgi:hypothetical protein